jgi:hypothetical protein
MHGTMRRTDLTRRSRNSTWRVRAVWLALVGTGLMTAIAAAEIGGRPGMTIDDAMTRTITRQRIAEGQVATTGAPPQTEPTTRDQILAEAAAYEADMNQSLAHTEKLRLQAYRAKDIIRMNFISGKLDEMKQIMMITQQALQAIRQPGQDLFVMRSKLSTIRQGADRLKQAMAAAESAVGDTTDPTSSAVGAANGEQNPSAGESDPAGVPSPGFDVERPTAASPYK